MRRESTCFQQILVIAAVVVVQNQSALEAAHIYRIAPYTLIDTANGDEYQISGHIETQCNNCVINDANQVELKFDLLVDGPSSLSFRSVALRGNSVFASRGLTATPDELVLPN